MPPSATSTTEAGSGATVDGTSGGMTGGAAGGSSGGPGGGTSGGPGDVGVAGVAGVPGAVGVPGPGGVPGVWGAPGAVGAPGSVGVPGTVGAVGVVGVAGVPGATGVPGVEATGGVPGRERSARARAAPPSRSPPKIGGTLSQPPRGRTTDPGNPGEGSTSPPDDTSVIGYVGASAPGTSPAPAPGSAATCGHTGRCACSFRTARPGRSLVTTALLAAPGTRRLRAGPPRRAATVPALPAGASTWCRGRPATSPVAESRVNGRSYPLSEVSRAPARVVSQVTCAPAGARATVPRRPPTVRANGSRRR